MNIYGLTFSALEKHITMRGQKSSKAPSAARFIYADPECGTAHMPEAGQRTKKILMEDFNMSLLDTVKIIKSDDSAKFLFSLHDSNIIEAVLMYQKHGNTLCISSQVGCSMGCSFCQSGRQKKIRNLETWEMTAQVMAVQNELSLKISNVVLMGMGEPLDNYVNVMDFISILNNPYMLAIGKNHISVSTCGIAPKIYEYAANPDCCLLAVSLHAPFDGLRNELMPINRIYAIDELMKSIDAYTSKVNKKVMIEYVMLSGVNDTPECALELAKLMNGRKCHVNLIPYNETQNHDFSKSSDERIMAFYNLLKKNNVPVTLRRVFGSSSNAACGQLRAEFASSYQAP